jgi:choloylglycine hydrolase
VFGTNLDLFIPGDGLILVNRRGIAKASYRTNPDGERAEYVSKYGSVTFTLTGREFAWGGMNEAGLVISTMELRSGEYPEQDERPAFFDGNWCQYILDTCGSVEEVIATNSSVTVREDQGYPSHYLVADADGGCAAIEYIDGELVVHTGGDMPVDAMANMKYGKAVEAWERGGPRWWWSNPGQSAERVAACQKRAEEYDAAVDTSAVDYAFGTLIHYVAAPHTRWSIVFDIAKKEIYYRTAQSPAFKHISMGSFDYSCSAPKLMIDVNAQLEGDVDEFFVPYDYQVSLGVFRTFCARYGIDVSEADAREFTGYFEKFECAE